MTKKEAQAVYDRMTGDERLWMIHALDNVLFSINMESLRKPPSPRAREIGMSPLVTSLMDLIRPGWGQATKEKRGDFYTEPMATLHERPPQVPELPPKRPPFDWKAPGPDPKCPKCRGEGSYMCDDLHGKICEVCCPHDQGWWELPVGYSHAGQMCCSRGCGFSRPKEEGE